MFLPEIFQRGRWPFALALALMAFEAGAQKALPFAVTGRDATGLPVERVRTEIKLQPSHYIPYSGASAATRSQFRQGFPRSLGSGICFKGYSGGKPTFWVLGDRGPNGDGPAWEGLDSKIFPVPHYNPAFGVVRLAGNQAIVSSLTDIVQADERRVSGLPHPRSSSGAIHEPALAESLLPLRADPEGIDSESIAWDGRHLWLSDEYGPVVLKVDPARGRIREKLQPGRGLPAVFARRRLNRGMEALTFDRDTGRLWGALQSPIDDGAVDRDGKTIHLRDAAPFIRWVELDPSTRAFRQFAYPIEAALYQRGESGQAKLGDMAAVGGGRFVVIEEGSGTDGLVVHRLYLVDAHGATDIDRWQGADLERSGILGRPVNGADWKSVIPLQKRLLVDLDQLGWDKEKAEGLALVDERTLALTNDNDYGVVSSLIDADGERVPGKIEHCHTRGKGPPLFGEQCPKGAVSVGEFRMAESSLTQELWLLRFARPLRSY